MEWNPHWFVTISPDYGALRTLANAHIALSGKGFDWGGSKIRPEATGYGLVYFVGHMINSARGEDFQGKTVAISGAGNVAQVSLQHFEASSRPSQLIRKRFCF